MGRIITESITFTLKLKPFSKKNGSRIVRKKSGVPFLIPSESYKTYEKDCGWFIPCKGMGISCPVNIEAIFYIDAARRCDLSNYIEALADILVHYKVIEDDCWKIVAGWDGSRMYVDRTNPRTEVTITPMMDVDHQVGMPDDLLEERF